MNGGAFLGFAETAAVAQQLRGGAILTQSGQASGIVSIPGGLIQDIDGAVFIPGATLKDVLAVVQDYNRHSQIYRPEIAAVKLQSRTGNDFVVAMRIVKSKFRLSVVLNTTHKIHYTQIDAKHAYSRAYSTRIAEVRNAGESDEHEMPVGSDHGLLWRLYGYWFFEEKDGGVYVECESITLTRDIPFLFAKIAGPVMRDLPAEALQATLRKTRAAATPVTIGPAR